MGDYCCRCFCKTQMAAPVAKLFRNKHKVNNESISAHYDYRLWLRDDGTCSYASISDVEDKYIEDEDEYDKNAPYGQVTYEVSWGRYELKVESEQDEKIHFGKVECKWAQRWQSRSYYDRRNPPSLPSPWKQSEQKLSTIDLDCGPPGTTEGDVATAAQLGSTLGLAEQTSPLDFRVFPSWPPADLTMKVITLATEASSNGSVTVICTDVGGTQCAVLDLDPQTQTFAQLRASIANKMEIDVHQLKIVLPDATLLEANDDHAVLTELLLCC